MGGNVAENAGGPRAFKYGVTRDWTLGMVTTLMGGETLRLGRRTPKGVTGYDLTALFVGSEGTFGVTSEITVQPGGPPGGRRHVHRRHARRGVGGARGQPRSSARATGRARWSCSTSASIDHVRTKAAYTFPADAGAIVLVELDGEPDGIEAAVLACGAVCEAEGARDVIIARDDVDRERLWQTRRVCSVALREALQVQAVRRTSSCRRARSPRCSGASTRSARATIWRRRPSATPATATCTSTCCRRRTRRDAAFDARVDAALAELFRATLDLGGTLSGEHGIGIAKARYMAWEQSAEVIDWQKRLKRCGIRRTC